MARNVATMFTEKGYENIFLMTGGLERFVHSTPSLCVGELPRNEGKENNKKKSGSRKNKNRGGRPPRPEYTAKVGQSSSGRPPRAPRGNRSSSNNNTNDTAPQLTKENVAAVEREHRTPNKRTPSKRAPSHAGSTQSRAESLLSWNAGERRNMQTSL